MKAVKEYIVKQYNEALRELDHQGYYIEREFAKDMESLIGGKSNFTKEQVEVVVNIFKVIRTKYGEVFFEKKVKLTKISNALIELINQD